MLTQIKTSSPVDWEDIIAGNYEFQQAAAGLQDTIRLHDHRHTFATLWLESGE